MSSFNTEQIANIKEFIDSQLDYAGNFIEFILGEKSISTYNQTAAELRILQKKIQQTTSRCLTIDETLSYQKKIF